VILAATLGVAAGAVLGVAGCYAAFIVCITTLLGR
jgi:hypothetical protein